MKEALQAMTLTASRQQLVEMLEVLSAQPTKRRSHGNGRTSRQGLAAKAEKGAPKEPHA